MKIVSEVDGIFLLKFLFAQAADKTGEDRARRSEKYARERRLCAPMQMGM